MVDHKLPPNLTEADWKAKKGIIAKMAGETNIGAALKKLDDRWKKLPWDDLEPGLAWSKQKLRRSSANLPTLMAEVKKQWPKVGDVQKELFAIRDLCDKIAAEWKRKPLIPASSRKHVEGMSAAAEKLFYEMKSLDLPWKKEATEIEAHEKKVKENGLKAMKPYFKSLKDNAKQVTDPESYRGAGTKGFHQNVRGLSVAISKSGEPTWIGWGKTNWTAMAQDGFLPKNDQDVQVKVKQVLTALAELEKMVG
jgi:hypothetical protein